MKLLNKILTIVFTITFIPACNDLVEGLNENPNSPTSAPFSNILTGVEVGNIILQTGETARRSGIFGGYYTGIQRQFQGFNTYTVTTSDFDALWEDGFANSLRNAKVAEETALDAGISGVSIGITQVLQAMIFGTETSLFGDIPFDDAVDFDVENPEYEGQLQVYGKIQSLLDEAISNLESGSGRPASGSDIYFDGDPDAWIAVANTLKARYYMHTGEYGQAYAAAGNGIQSMGNSLYAPHGSAQNANNLTYQLFELETRGSDLVVSDFMTSLVASDPGINPDINNYRGHAKTDETGRFSFYFQENDLGIQPNTTDGFAAAEAPAPIVTYQENLLILAEAGFRSEGFATGLSRLNEFRTFMSSGGYLDNVPASDIQYDAYVAADFDNGGIENPDGVSSDNALLREIMEERYITLFAQIEGFCDVRRSANEATVRVPVPVNRGAELPERFLYPQSEVNRNSNTPDPLPGLFEPTPVNQ